MHLPRPSIGGGQGVAQEPPAWFVAKPEGGSVNLVVWHCIIPGKPGFSEDYPRKPPRCRFPQSLPDADFLKASGTVCLSIVNEDSGWRPDITVKQILVGIQVLLDQPNPADPAQTEG